MNLELRYRDNNTAVHRLHPAVKLAWGTGVVILSFIFDHPLYLAACFLAVIVMVQLADIRRAWFSTLKWGIWLGISIIIINTLVSHHGTHSLIIFPFSLPVLGQPSITLEALAYSAITALKLLVIISTFSFINLTVHPDDIMSVLLKIKVPYKSVLVTSLSTRFVPCLVEDVRRISDAYCTRGVLLDTGSWITRLKKRAGIIIPLLSSSLDRAMQVAEAMESRAFGNGSKRVFYKNITMTSLDLITLVACLASLLSGVLLRFSGYGSYQCYPTLEPIASSSLEWLLPVVVCVILLFLVPLAYIKKRANFDQD